MTYQEFLRRAEEDNCDTMGVTVNCENCATLIALCRKLEEQRDVAIETSGLAEHFNGIYERQKSRANAELDKIVEGGT